MTAMIALDTASGDAAAVVKQQLQDRTVDEAAAAGGIRVLEVLAISGDMRQVATAVYGALGTGPRGEVTEVTHTWEDVETRLGWLVLTVVAVLDDLTGDAWNTLDDRLRFPRGEGRGLGRT
ncbi:hypothetical protein ACIA78_21085 [Streptomyces xanthochromogenes]|uniref:hypothetical protein n=1 Tax=Streptomyces xanthochromogenes TaxID=67384 RepID=UPI0037BC8EAE